MNDEVESQETNERTRMTAGGCGRIARSRYQGMPSRFWLVGAAPFEPERAGMNGFTRFLGDVARLRVCRSNGRCSATQPGESRRWATAAVSSSCEVIQHDGGASRVPVSIGDPASRREGSYPRRVEDGGLFASSHGAWLVKGSIKDRGVIDDDNDAQIAPAIAAVRARRHR
jgi:hypothetical protein